SSESQPVINIDVTRATDLLAQQSPHRYLDVRTEEEFKIGHVANAVNIPYMFNTPRGRIKNPEFVDKVLGVFGKEDDIIVGCQSGVRSASAASDLMDAGFEKVVNMAGGYNAWIRGGFPVHK
ncbi:hypothetical protein M569_15510, partial [Genlisea aurea]